MATYVPREKLIQAQNQITWVNWLLGETRGELNFVRVNCTLIQVKLNEVEILSNVAFLEEKFKELNVYSGLQN